MDQIPVTQKIGHSRFPNPDMFDRFAHSVRRLLTLPVAPALAGYGTMFVPLLQVPNPC